MPTGYTADVVDGKVTTFKDFALLCSRAFGALITMRDDPLSTSLPDEIKPDEYYKNELEEAHQRLSVLRKMTPEEAEVAAQTDYQKKLDYELSYQNKQDLENDRLHNMLKRVKEWQPPTAEHSGLKEFMIQQLTISFNKPYPRPAPVRLSGQEWLQNELKEALARVERCAGEWAKEVARAKGRTAWIQALKNSL